MNNFTSVEWWVGVVIVGLSINLAAAYLKPLIDKNVAKFSEKKASKLKAKDEAREALIKKLMSSAEERYMYKLELLEKYIECISYLLWAVVFLGFAAIQSENYAVLKSICTILSTIYLMLWLKGLLGYHQDNFLLFEARNRNNDS